MFPFTFNGVEYKKCFFAGEINDFICGTEKDATEDGGWGICHKSCPKVEGFTGFSYGAFTEQSVMT